MLKTIIFDAYGTLFDTGTGSVDAAGRILEKCGRSDISAADFYKRWKQLHRLHTDSLTMFANEEEIFHRDLRALYGEYGINSNADCDVGIMLATLGKRRLFPEAKAVVNELHGRYALCIGSTTDTEPLLQDVKRGNTAFDRIFTSESLRCYKPSAEFYEKILAAMKIKPEEALFVGDSLIDDVTGPQRVGIKSCWINRRSVSAVNCMPEFELADLKGVVQIAETLR